MYNVISKETKLFFPYVRKANVSADRRKHRCLIRFIPLKDARGDDDASNFKHANIRVKAFGGGYYTTKELQK